MSNENFEERKMPSFGGQTAEMVETREKAQDRFNRTYISSTEISKRMQVSRPTVFHARRRGTLPDPIVVDDSKVFLWEREYIEPFLQAWELALKSRRGELRTGDFS